MFVWRRKQWEIKLAAQLVIRWKFYDVTQWRFLRHFKYLSLWIQAFCLGYICNVLENFPPGICKKHLLRFYLNFLWIFLHNDFIFFPFVMFKIQSHSISRSIFCCRKLRLRLNFKYRWTVTFFRRQFIAVGVVGRSQIFIDETSARMFDVISAVVRNM